MTPLVAKEATEKKLFANIFLKKEKIFFSSRIFFFMDIKVFLG